MSTAENATCVATAEVARAASTNGFVPIAKTVEGVGYANTGGRILDVENAVVVGRFASIIRDVASAGPVMESNFVNTTDFARTATTVVVLRFANTIEYAVCAASVKELDVAGTARTSIFVKNARVLPFASTAGINIYALFVVELPSASTKGFVARARPALPRVIYRSLSPFAFEGLSRQTNAVTQSNILAAQLRPCNGISSSSLSPG